MVRVLLDCDVRLFLGANLEVAKAAGSKINRASEQSHVQHNTDPVSIRRNLKNEWFVTKEWSPSLQQTAVIA